MQKGLGIAKLKNQLQPLEFYLAKERAERGSKGKTEGCLNDNVVGKRLLQQAKQARLGRDFKFFQQVM